MYKYLVLSLVAVSTVVGCGGSNKSNNDHSPPKLLSSPELLEGEALVYISTGSKQCQNNGMSHNVTAQLLIDKGVDVISSHCGDITGLLVPAACGADTLEINLHTINSQNIPDAQNEGFEPVSKLSERIGVGYQVIECKG